MTGAGGDGAVADAQDVRYGVEAPYAALWQFPSGRGVQEYVEDQLGAWLREKHIDVDLAETAVHRFGDDRVFVARHESRGAPEFQVRLVEHTDSGVWRTELTTRVPNGELGWLRLRVTNDRGAYVAPPRLASYLLANGAFRDGGVLDLTERPSVVSSVLVEDLAEVITDFSREGLVFVAGTDDSMPFDPFRDMVERWTREVVGLAEAYVLDPIATRELAEILGEAHAVMPWTIRTFMPDVDPAVADNARRHRWLSTSRLADWPMPRIQRTLGRVARSHADTRPLPDHVMHSLRAFVRMENQLLVDSVGRSAERVTQLDAVASTAEGRGQTTADAAATSARVPDDAQPAPDMAVSVAEGAAAFLRSMDLVRTILGVPEVTEASLQAFVAGWTAKQEATRTELGQRLAEQEDEITRLSDQVSSMRGLLDDAEVDMAILQEERDDLADTEQWLRRQFRSSQLAYLTSAPLPLEERTVYPSSFSELLDWVNEDRMPGVAFSGDSRPVIDLDLHSGMDVALRTAFDAVLALRDYVRAKADGWSGNVDTYLRTPPDGCRSIAPKKHAANESETILGNSRLCRMRVFGVPGCVDASGSALMVAHFKLGLMGQLSPRLYYLDDTGRTGKVYVGYIGRHLENTKTN